MTGQWRRIMLWWELAFNFIYDWRRYKRHSFVLGARTRENRRAMLHILAHSLEHGMSLSAPRRGYGTDKASSLAAKLDAYLDAFEPDASSAAAIKVLRAYVGFHQAHDFDVSAIAAKTEKLEKRAAGFSASCAGGVTTLTKSEIKKATAIDFTRFMKARHSVRQYSDQTVDFALIERAVANAQQVPSVCNRQTCKAYVFTQKDAIARALSFQSGNAGFGHEVTVLFIVTANMQHLNLIGERYQGWIDGGIFAEALCLSLHAEGLGTCFLNWSAEKERDQAMRRCVGIPDGELVITMMAAGHVKPEFAVPVSQRKPLAMAMVVNPPLT